MVANKYAFLQITRRRFLNEWEAFKKVISRRNIRRRITIPLTLSNLKLLRRITRTENILHRNFTRRQVAIQNRVASNIGISQSTFSVKVQFVLITLLNVTLIILTLSVSRLLNLLLRLVAFLLFLNPQCLASISRWITASSSWKRFCLFVCRALSSIMVICMLTAIRLLLTFVMSLYLLLRS